MQLRTICRFTRSKLPVIAPRRPHPMRFCRVEAAAPHRKGVAVSELPRIDIQGESEPAVALALLRIIMDSSKDGQEHDRDWILSTYADCLAVVGGAEVSYDEEEKGPEEG